MTIIKTSFKVYVNEIIHVAPSKPTPNLILPLSTIDSDYDHDVPAYSVRVYRGTMHPNQFNPAHVLREALSKVLVYYYPLSGKLKRQEHERFYVDCNTVEVPFVVASASCKLSDVDYIDGEDISYGKHLVYDFPPEDETGKHSMVLQVTTFLCGGFTVGIGTWHAICDGTGAVQLWNALTELASGMSEPSVMPLWERERLNGSVLKQPVQLPMNPSVAAVSPYLPTTDLALQCFHVDNNCLRNLKFSLMKESEDPTVRESSFTTFEVLAAYLWRSRCKALKLNADGETLIWIGVGVRERMHPPLPMGYYGNAYILNYHVMKVKDLVGGPLLNVVKQVKELKNHAFSNEFMRNALNYSETIRRLEIHPETYEGGVIDMVDWRQLVALQEVDFGWGRSVNLVTMAKSMLDDIDVCIIAPPSSVHPSIEDGVKSFCHTPRCMHLNVQTET